MKAGDTWPPLRGLASDEDGPVDLSTADALEVRIKGTSVLISGTPVAIQPPLTDSAGNTYNWQYNWAAGDTTTVGSYNVQLKVTWDNATVPPEVEHFPNTGGDTLTIEAAN